MNSKQRKLKLASFSLTLMAGAFLCHSNAIADDEDRNVRSWSIKGLATTGPNDRCGVPQWGLPAPLPEEGRFTFLGEYDPKPGATDAIPLTSANCRPGTLLATTTDLNFQGFFGFPDADARLKNTLLRDVPINASLNEVRMDIPVMGTVPPNPLPGVRSLPVKPITLGDWFKAKGTLRIRCLPNNTSFVDASFKNLIPNGVYTMFGIWKTTLPGASSPTFLPVALGGVPNVVAVDDQGVGTFSRKLSGCPKDPSPDGSVLMFVDLAYHPDGNTHGVFPFTPMKETTFIDSKGNSYESTRPAGIATFVQMGFPVTVRPLR